jgi:homocysteine S-methyltransferase
MAHPLLDRLSQGPLLADGAMGTMLYARGASLDENYDQLNLTNPELVASVHRAYLAAGADLIETNTFGANRFRLDLQGLGDQVVAINKRAAKIAREEREISGLSTIVAGAIGSTLRSLEPFGVTTRAEVRHAFREQIDALLEGGVDCLIFETFGNIDELEEALLAAREACDLPIIAMMTFAEDGVTIGGSSVGDVVERLAPFEIDVLGANCSVGPSKLLNVTTSMRSSLRERGDHRPLACMPNAGWPTHSGGRVIYPSTPEYFGEFARQAVASGITLIGGCCGTTPEHIRVMRTAIDETVGEVTVNNGHRATKTGRPTSFRDIAADDGPTKLANEIGNKFLVSVEIDPPKGLNPEKALEGARLLKEAGVDAINVADSPMARVRMSALTLCYLIQHEINIETIVHFTTRDRSLMGLQSELLGAHAAGVRNILALTGDPPSLGNYPGSSAVFDVDSIGLIRVLNHLNNGVDSAGASIGRQANFSIACAVDPTKKDLVDEARRLHAKIDAGAHFVMTQPIYDVNVWTTFLEYYGEPIPVPVMIGILPLQSSKHAEFLHHEVPGITLSDAARDRMRRAGPGGRAEGVKIAQELLAELRPHAQGVYLMPSFGRYEVAAEVLEILDPNGRIR